MEINYSLNAGIEICGAVFCLLGFVIVSFMGRIRVQKTMQYKLFGIAFILMCIAMLSEFGCSVTESKLTVGAFIINSFGNFLQFAINPALALIIIYYLDCYIHEELERTFCKKFAWAMVLINLACVIVTPFTGLLYYFDEANFYHRGAYNWITYVASFLILLMICGLYITFREKIPRASRVALLLFCIVPFVAAVFQILFYGFPILYVSLTVVSMIMIFCAYYDTSEEMLRQQKIIEETNLKILNSQLQPHFLYNTIGAIMGIEGNPPETVDALAGFGKYLRGNLNILSGKVVVPFAGELQHVKQYIQLEQLRFGDRVNVRYDIRVANFVLPVLTVQMLAENAIKHGITKKIEGGTIKISTFETASYYVIKIEDDGVGFDPYDIPHTERNHYGIGNVRDRLEILVKGSLNIESTPGKGTVATVYIDKKAQQEEAEKLKKTISEKEGH